MFNLQPFYIGKPAVEGLGYAFLMRNYRAGLGKWQTQYLRGSELELKYVRHVDESTSETVNFRYRKEYFE